MRAVRLLGLGDLAVVDVARPEPGDHDVVVQVQAAGICGTDRHLFLGEFPSRPPVTLGHEFAGVVVAVGAKVGIAPGTLVACDPNIFCGTCAECRRGRVNLCEANVAIGLARDGGFAEYAVIPAHRALPLPAGMTAEAGAFAEPLACTLHGLDVARLIPGERAMVLGGGVIGLLAVQLARAAGAEVLLVTRNPHKRAVALGLGAQHTAATLDEAQALWPRGADAVIECAGVTETMTRAPDLAAPGGRVVILGVLPKGAKVAWQPFDLLFREVSILPAFINPFTQSRALDLIANGTVQTAPLISRRVTLEEAAHAIATPALPADIKLLVLP
ncbi:alcohol dehydrogenase catalytic domain-containing protein [Rhodobacter sp. KR11]|uniref:alcohol dehydrogenase catalytic domain-containing protein n=1 Tax=Rhodobacter sp. KR11 TaxID=2974588 RepID=UPI00222318E8|nr:alcohol dehydrogenase catalytic domain-containing protein [Rhodobacter sp. KR11]MCW1917804.1 alcohol dehydrogenase catalytic domain-containing protein [Rhodobacter sp. KR11]